MATKYRYKKRAFLNKEINALGLIIAIVPQAYENRTGNFDKGLYPTLTIGDCSRQISLDFSYYSKRERKEKKEKLMNFVSIINDFKDAMLEAFEFSEEVEAKDLEGIKYKSSNYTNDETD